MPKDTSTEDLHKRLQDLKQDMDSEQISPSVKFCLWLLGFRVYDSGFIPLRITFPLVAVHPSSCAAQAQFARN